ncbi:hypothetical protein GCM10017668_04480 [Streptomyces tuirus]|uniref:Uncharacterized protein n=1 Tax=Streptomyces tuirus TaxID=68278 RepID=A0A7G1NBM0_9ACTN|nr:hypothetical protein GCM10017668_04480 [Streptomyces tuirus]
MHGRDKVTRLLTAGRGGPDHPVWRYRRVNGDDAAVLFDGDAPFAVLVLDLTPEGDRVRGIYVVANPDKLAHLPAAGDA